MFALFCLCVSCKTQQITPEQKSEHQEALASLRSGCFIVQLDALYPSSASPLTPALTEYKEMRESYLKANGGDFSYYISPNDGMRSHIGFPADRKENLRAEVSEGKKKRNGECRFHIKVRGEGIVDDRGCRYPAPPAFKPVYGESNTARKSVANQHGRPCFPA